MTEKVKYLFLIICVCLTNIMITAQESETRLRPITTSTMFHLGDAQFKDTYLSPNLYEGYAVGISNERLQIFRWGKDRITTQQNVGFSFMKGHNMAQNGNSFSGFINYSYGFLYTFRPLPRLKLLAGAQLGGYLGFVYNPKNSNNPASAKANINMALTGMGIYSFNIKKYPITIRYQLTLPTAGLFFAPQYGQSYYEIFSLGNHDGIIHFGSYHNHFEIENLFTVDLPLGRNAIRLGYKHHLSSENVNDIQTKFNINSFVLGVTGELLPINQRKKNLKAPIINAFY